MSTASQLHEADDERGDPAEHDPDEERDGEEEPEEDGQPAALEVVADDEPRPAPGAPRIARATATSRHVTCQTPGVAARQGMSVRPTTIARWRASTVGRERHRSRRRATSSVRRGHRLHSHADPLLPHARAGRLPQGRAPPAHRLVQAARRAHEARLAHAGGEGARRHRDLGREPRASGRVGRGAGGDRRARRHVARRERGEDRRDARVRRRGRPRRGRSRRRRSQRLDVLLEETGRTLVHPFDDPFTIAGQGTVGLEILEDLPRRRDDRRAGRRRRAHLGSRGRGRRTRRVVGVEPELVDRAALRARRGRARRTSTPTSIADGLNAPFAGAGALAIAPGARRRGRSRLGGRDRGRLPLPLRAGEARLRAGGRGGRRGGARGEDRRAVEPSASSRAGTSPPQTAAAILASR